MNLSLTQPLTEMNTTIISFGDKCGWFLDLMKYLRSFTDNFEIWRPQSSVTLRGFQDMCRYFSTFIFTLYI